MTWSISSSCRWCRPRTSSGDYSVASLPYPSLLALRLLLLADSQPSLYRQFRLLASLLPQWRAAPGWLEGQHPTIRLVRDTLGLHHLQEEEILQVICHSSSSSSSSFRGSCFLAWCPSNSSKPAAQAAGQTLPYATPPIGKIHPFRKIIITLEPIQRYKCPTRIRFSEKMLI